MFKKFDAKEDVVGTQQLKGSVQVCYEILIAHVILSVFLKLFADIISKSSIPYRAGCIGHRVVVAPQKSRSVQIFDRSLRTGG
jgi:hypothetical protein